jgi:hypothetical protein
VLDVSIDDKAVLDRRVAVAVTRWRSARSRDQRIPWRTDNPVRPPGGHPRGRHLEGFTL